MRRQFGGKHQTRLWREGSKSSKGSKGSKGCGGALGHTFGVRVDGTSSRRFLRFLSLTALWAEGGGIALTVHSEHILHYANWICKGASAT